MKMEIRPQVWLDSRRAIFLEETRTLVVADIHWGYARAHAATGNLLPHWGDEQIAETLRALISDFEPHEMIWLGDSVHAVSGAHSAEAFLEQMTSGLVVHLLRGNHDRRWRRPQLVHVTRGQFLLHHGDASITGSETSRVEMIGHHHPACIVGTGFGNRLKLPALVASPQRIILPAFSPWAAGTPWKSGSPGEEIWAIGANRIFRIDRAEA